MRILVTICARGGSKGIPGKNIKLINGKPLIQYSIDIANRFAKDKNAVVSLSTDSDEIRAVAANCGLISDYERPAELATDTAGKIPVLKDLLSHEEARLGQRFDLLLDLDVSSPLRTLEDLEEGLLLILSDKNALNLFSVSPAVKNPYFNMVERQDSGYYSLVKKGNFLSRQSAPVVFELNASFYYYRREFFEQDDLSTISKRSLVFPMQHICFDLDHQVDFEFLHFLLNERKLGFEI